MADHVDDPLASEPFVQPLLPPFAAVAERFEGAIASGEPSPALNEELHALGAFLGTMRDAFRHELCYQDLTQDEEDVSVDIIDAFHLAFEAFEPIAAALEVADVEAFTLEARALIGHLRTLTLSFARLRDLEATRPVLSPIPAVHDLLRAAQAVREDRLSFDAIEARLLPIIPVLQQARASLGRPGGDHPLLGTLLDAHCEAIDALAACVEEEDLDGLDAAMAAVAETAQAVFDAQPARLHADAAVETLCPKCGAAVGEHDRACGACGARLPERTWETPVSREVGRPDGLPVHADAISDLVERLHAGEPCLEAFQVEVQGLRACIEAAQALFEQAPGAPGDAPEHERIACESAQHVMRQALDLWGAALVSFEAVCAGGEPWRLDQGVQQMRDAVEQMGAFPHIVERLGAVS